jgi:hypothetical protein
MSPSWNYYAESTTVILETADIWYLDEEQDLQLESEEEKQWDVLAPEYPEH